MVYFLKFRANVSAGPPFGKGDFYWVVQCIFFLVAFLGVNIVHSLSLFLSLDCHCQWVDARYRGPLVCSSFSIFPTLGEKNPRTYYGESGNVLFFRVFF